MLLLFDRRGKTEGSQCVDMDAARLRIASSFSFCASVSDGNKMDLSMDAGRPNKDMY
jgi:hypothetical protein